MTGPRYTMQWEHPGVNGAGGWNAFMAAELRTKLHRDDAPPPVHVVGGAGVYTGRVLCGWREDYSYEYVRDVTRAALLERHDLCPQCRAILETLS